MTQNLSNPSVHEFGAAPKGFRKPARAFSAKRFHATKAVFHFLVRCVFVNRHNFAARLTGVLNLHRATWISTFWVC